MSFAPSETVSKVQFKQFKHFKQRCKWEIPRVNCLLSAKLGANAQILTLAPNFKNKRDKIGCKHKTTKNLQIFVWDGRNAKSWGNDTDKNVGFTLRGQVVKPRLNLKKVQKFQRCWVHLALHWSSVKRGFEWNISWLLSVQYLARAE